MVNERASVAQVLHHRNYQRARARALVRLSRIFRDEYKQFLEEERALDESLGKTWVGIDPGTGSPITIESHKNTVASNTSSSNGSADEGDNGGKA